MYICVYICVCVYVYRHICICIWMRDWKRGRERDFLSRLPVPFKTTLKQGNFQFPLTCKHAVLPQPLWSSNRPVQCPEGHHGEETGWWMFYGTTLMEHSSLPMLQAYGGKSWRTLIIVMVTWEEARGGAAGSEGQLQELHKHEDKFTYIYNNEIMIVEWWLKDSLQRYHFTVYKNYSPFGIFLGIILKEAEVPCGKFTKTKISLNNLFSLFLRDQLQQHIFKVFFFSFETK